MRIALISQLYGPVRESFSGGTEVFVYNLAEELARRGHKVTVFATGDSELKNSKLISVVDRSYWAKLLEATKEEIEDIYTVRRWMGDEVLGYLKSIIYLKKNANDFDIVHNHSLNYISLTLPDYLLDLPFLTTLHFPEHKTRYLEPSKELTRQKRLPGDFVTVSENQKEATKGLDVMGYVHNGISLGRFTFNPDGGDYIAWAGRIVPEKGLDVALAIAKKLNLPIKFIGSSSDLNYFEKIKKIASQNQRAEYLGELSGQNLVEFYQKAKVILLPIRWDEPFGLVSIEAMACGAPLIVFDRGAFREIIKDDETGFIVPPDDIDAMAKAVQKIYDMPEEEYAKMRRNCRQHVEANFTVEKMVDGYEKVYQKVIDDWRNSRS